MVGEVRVGGDGVSAGVEVGAHGGDGTGVRDVAGLEEDAVVEEEEDFAGGLVDGAHDSAAAGVAEGLEQLHDLEGGVRVKARRGLVKEDEGRVRDELHANAGTLALTPADSLDELAADEGVGATLQAEVRDHGRDKGLDLGGRLVETAAEGGGEAEGLPVKSVWWCEQGTTATFYT